MKRKHILHLLMMALLLPVIVNAQNLPADGSGASRAELTIYGNGGNLNSTVIPFCGQMASYSTSSQFIIPAATLNTMAGSAVNKLTFYSTNDATKDWGNAVFKVYMAEVEQDQFVQAEFNDWESMTMVYQGSLSISNYRMEINLPQNYIYTGDNLMIGFKLIQTGTGGTATAWAVEDTEKGTGIYAIDHDVNGQVIINADLIQHYLPKMTFNYTLLPYPRVYPITCNVNGTVAEMSWEAPSAQVTGYAYQYREITDAWGEEWLNTTNTSVEISNLVPGREFDFRVKALYGSNESVPTRIRFIAECPTLVNAPYAESFDSYQYSGGINPQEYNLPNCWSSINNSTNVNNSGYPAIYGFVTKVNGQNIAPYSYSPGNSLLFSINNFGAQDPQPQYAILPAMQHIKILRVTCKAVKARRGTNVGWENYTSTFKIGIMEDDDTFTEMGTFTPQDYTTSYPTSDDFTTFTLDFSNYTGTGNRIAFMMPVPTTPYGRVCIDDIQVAYTVEVPSVFTKHIDSWETPDFDGWYLISSPLADNTNPADVQNMLNSTNPEDFDLYRFEQNTVYFDEQEHGLEWENWKAADPKYNIEPLRGYLYANRNTDTLIFSGVPYYGDGKVRLKRTENVEFTGWNLIGNPWNSYASISRAYYRINPAGNEVIAGNGNIEPMEAVFVIAEADGEEVTFTATEAPTPKEAMNMALNLSHNNGKVIDRTILNFGEGGTLQKFQLNPNNTKVYIPQNGKDYAVVRAEGQGEMPINFRAAENGSYTLSLSKDNVDFNYLHLIDNMTSADIDLLSTPSYTFNAKTTDYEYRFKLVYASSNDNESFGFIDEVGNFSVYGVQGEATLQMIDMMGRVLSTETVNGSIEKKIDNAGVYMFRLINGDNVKVQKVVVK